MHPRELPRLQTPSDRHGLDKDTKRSRRTDVQSISTRRALSSAPGMPYGAIEPGNPWFVMACCVVVTQTSYPNKITETSGPRVLGIGLSRDMLAIKSIEAHFGINRVSYHDDVIKWKDFRVTDLCEGKPPVIGGFPSRRPVTWGFDVFFLSVPERTVEQTIKMSVIWDAIAFIMTPL